MKRGLDLDKAEAALKRAAEKAIHGTREERSGRFRSQGGYAVRRGGERVRDTKAGAGDKWRKP